MKVMSSRELSKVEAVIYYITTHKRCFNNIGISILKASGLSETVIRKALRIIQQSCVELRSIVREKIGKPFSKSPFIPRYEIAETDPLPQIPVYTLPYDENFYQTLSEINGTNFPLNQPIIQIYLFEHNTNNEIKALGVYFNHAFGDATLMDHFTHHLLTVCGNVIRGETDLPLLSGEKYEKPLSEWLGKASFSEWLKLNGELVKSIFEQKRHHVLTDVKNYEKIPFNERSHPQVYMFELDPEGTQALRDRVKKEGFSLNDVFIGGITMALANVIRNRINKDKVILKTYYAVDLRKRLSPPIPGGAFILAANNRIIHLELRKKTTIWEIADHIRRDVRNFLKEIWKFKIIRNRLYKKIFPTLIENEKDFGSLLISNRGLSVTEPEYGDKAIKMLFHTFTGCNLLTLTGGPIIFFVMGQNTDKGLQLSMTVNWYKPWMTEETWKDLSRELINVARIKAFNPMDLIK